ncbi:MAG: amidohydrolase [Deltaproteobacteria bacterium]|nr:amidohydrolase [Deltaproteobacteria bacterium]
MFGYDVVDADGHILEPEAELRKHLEPPHNMPGRRSLVPRDHWNRSLGGRMGKETFDLETRLRDMDKEGIDVAVIFPTFMLNVGIVRERDFAAALCRAYNNWLADQCRQSNGRLKGVAVLPVTNVPAAVKELGRSVTELGFVGGMLAAHGHGRDFGEEAFHPLYAEAERLDCALGIHSSAGGWAAGENRFERFICMHTVAHPLEQMIHLTGVMFGGIPELFPRLRIAFLESGIGWFPYWMERLDEEWEKRGDVEAPHLKRKPSEYMRGGQIYYSFEPEEKTLPYVMKEWLGEDLIMYASDYPHWDALIGRSAAEVMHRTDLTEGQKKKLLGANARRFFRLT